MEWLLEVPEGIKPEAVTLSQGSFQESGVYMVKQICLPKQKSLVGFSGTVALFYFYSFGVCFFICLQKELCIKIAIIVENCDQLCRASIQGK